MGLTNNLGKLSNMITSTGSAVGIGTSSPSYLLDIVKNAVNSVRIQNTGNNADAYLITQNTGGSAFFGINETGPYIYTQTALATQFYTNNAERMRITSAGNIGIGTSSPSSKLEVQDGYINIYHNNGTNGAGYALQFLTDGGGSKNTIGYISIFNVGTARAGDMLFGTSNGSGPLERMRITSGGEWCLGTTTAVGAGLANIKGNSALFNLLSIQNTNAQGNFIYFMNPNGTQAGAINNYLNTTVQYTSASDYRLKEDLQEIKGLDKVLAIKVYDFKWKNNDFRMDGVLAHELQDIMPFAVNGEKDAINKDGSIKSQSVDYSKIVPALVKAIQELEARLKTLENK